jgi:tetraacyldisaccharide 4'-kinase
MVIFQILLKPISWIYGIVVYIRNIVYDFGIIPVYHPPIPVISVGNITAGGTGKTPFVEYLVKRYISKGSRTCVISRGYKRLTRGMQVVSDGYSIRGNAISVGDEPYQIAKKFTSAIIVVSEKRAVAADYVLKEFKPQLFILDDGFQHRSIARNIDIVMIDGTCELNDIPLIPAGRRREQLSSLRRADLLIRSGGGKNHMSLTDSCNVEMRYKVKEFRSIKGDKIYSVDQMRGKKCVVFAGIGNPASLLSTLKENEIEVVQFHKFPDHHIYTEKEMGTMCQSLETARGDFIVTTEKDIVRLESLALKPGFPTQFFLFLIIECQIVRGEEALLKILNEKVDQFII